MKMLLPFLPAILALAGTMSAVAATSSEDHAVYAWYDSLGHPRLNDFPWAQVFVQFSFEGQQPDNQQYRGFIAKSGKDLIHIIAPDLRSSVLQPANPAYHITPGSFHWEVRDLAADMRTILAGPLPEPFDTRQPFFAGCLAQRAQLVVYARTLQALGEEEVATALLVTARKLPLPDGPDQESRFREALAIDFGAAEMKDLLLMLGGLDFGAWHERSPGTHAPRTQVLQKAERIIRSFPNTPHATEVRALAATLRLMIAEDAAHPQISGAELSKLPAQARVAELIFRLRDLSAQSRGKGGLNVLSEVSPNKDTTAHRLADLGHAAVPQLMEALNDTRPSRSIDMDTKGLEIFTPRQVLTIGDCAERILSHIARRPFFQASEEHPTMSEAGKAEQTRQSVLAWWEQVQTKESKLPVNTIEGASRGDPR